MISIIWTISQLDCLPTTPEGDDYAITAHWRCTGTEDVYTTSSYGTASFPVVHGETFTPYADLTQDQVLGWVWENGVDKDATEASVQQQLDNLVNPPIVVLPLPWAAA